MVEQTDCSSSTDALHSSNTLLPGAWGCTDNNNFDSYIKLPCLPVAVCSWEESFLLLTAPGGLNVKWLFGAGTRLHTKIDLYEINLIHISNKLNSNMNNTVLLNFDKFVIFNLLFQNDLLCHADYTAKVSAGYFLCWGENVVYCDEMRSNERNGENVIMQSLAHCTPHIYITASFFIGSS